MANINTRQHEKNTVQIKCTESGKTVTGELISTTKAGIQVILPGFIKVFLRKDPKPHFYVGNQAGLEFTCYTK